FLEAEFPAQRLHVCRRQFLRLAAQQRAGQGDAAVADALEPRDLAALRFPHPADLAVAAFGEHHAEPVVRAGAADALDLVELRRTVLQRDAAAQALDDAVGHAFLAFRGAHPADILALDPAG